MPGTTYHYRLVVSSTEGTFTGPDQHFTTAAGASQPTPPTTVGPPAAIPLTPTIHTAAFVIDTGGAVARLSRTRRFTIPGLRFTCPADASASCPAHVVVTASSASAAKKKKAKTLASGLVRVVKGKTGAVTLKASSKLVKMARTSGLVRLKAVATFSAPGTNPVTVKKAFVLTAKRH